jgi:hypothetical protein
MYIDSVKVDILTLPTTAAALRLVSTTAVVWVVGLFLSLCCTRYTWGARGPDRSDSVLSAAAAWHVTYVAPEL